MAIYKPTHIRPLRLLAASIRGLGNLLSAWPLLLIAGILISSVGPHVLTEYRYVERGSHRHMIACDYLGSRGFVTVMHKSTCPFVILLDRRKGYE